MTLSRLMPLLAALFWLTGCALGGEPAARYALPETASPPTPAEISPVLRIRPLRLAGFLDADGLIVQLDDVTLHEASGHRWAEPLGHQLERRLRDRLAAELPDIRVTLDDEATRDAVTWQLRVTVERFQGRPDGHAVAAGRWQLLDGEGGLCDSATFEVASPLAADGYPALVRALGQSWNGVAEGLAAAVRHQPAPRLR